MAAFIDDLTLVLDLLILISAVVFYTAFFVWYHSRRNDPARAATHLREGAILMTLIGGIIGLIALWGEFTWPIPATIGSYDLYFFDPLLLLALLTVGFGLAVIFRLPTHMVGMLGVVIGLGVMYYGVRAEYYLKLTQDPLETLLMYLGFGAVAILSYPATLYVDWFVTGRQNPALTPIASASTPTYPRLWTVLLGLFIVMILLAGIAAAAYGLSAAWGHLESPP
jgi:putative membrane protein